MAALRQRLIHLAYRTAQHGRRLWWRIARPEVFGAKAVVIDDDGGHVLLVRHSYTADLWMLPGGGVKRGEDAAVAVLREIAEETGITARDPVLHARFLDTRHGARNHISLFRCTAPGQPPHVDGREIIAAAWHPVDALPANTAPATRRRIEEIRDGRAPEGQAWA